MQTHRRGVWYAAFYPEFRQFTSGKAYSVVHVRGRSGVVFVFDDGDFRVALNEFQGRRFVIHRSPVVANDYIGKTHGLSI